MTSSSPHITCPRCRQPIPNVRLQHLEDGRDAGEIHATFSCTNKRETRHLGRIRCGQPIILSHNNGDVVAVFPSAWDGKPLSQLVEENAKTAQRMPR